MTVPAIQSQIELAQCAIAKYGYTVPAVIKEIKLSARAKKVFYGFHFEDNRTTGETGTHDDGSVYKIIAIVKP
jgi:hypothetical protein